MEDMLPCKVPLFEQTALQLPSCCPHDVRYVLRFYLLAKAGFSYTPVTHTSQNKLLWCHTWYGQLWENMSVVRGLCGVAQGVGGWGGGGEWQQMNKLTPARKVLMGTARAAIPTS